MKPIKLPAGRIAERDKKIAALRQRLTKFEATVKAANTKARQAYEAMEKEREEISEECTALNDWLGEVHEELNEQWHARPEEWQESAEADEIYSKIDDAYSSGPQLDGLVITLWEPEEVDLSSVDETRQQLDEVAALPVEF